VTLPQQPAANDVIGNAILEFDAIAVSAVPFVPPVSPHSTEYQSRNAGAGQPTSRYPLEVLGKQILVETPLVGRHQLRNLALAIAAAEQLAKKGFGGITPASIERGIRETNWPGRFQVLNPRGNWPEVVLDVAHNPAGAWALRSALSERYGDRPLIFVFGAMRDKAISEMTEILFPMGERVIATRPENPRAASPDEIVQAASRTGAEMESVMDVSAALARARDLARPDSTIVVTGSIYLVGEAMRILDLHA
jgi:dihydrofolate synthase / folylpolyglutamate synthase